MRIEDLKRWQWCVIGVFIGFVVAAINQWAGPAEDPRTNTQGPHVFEDQLLDRHDPSRRRVFRIENVMIHPATELPLPGKPAGFAEVLTYDALLVRPDKPTVADRVPNRMLLQYYNPSKRKSIVPNIERLGLRDYLEQLKKRVDEINQKKPGAVINFDYHYRWIETPAGAYTLYPVGGLVLIGLIWPSVIGLLTHAGFGRVRGEDEYDLSRFGRSRTTSSGPKKPAFTAADAEELARLEAEMEARLRSGSVGMTQASSDGEGSSPPAVASTPVRTLDAGPLEPAKPAGSKAQEKGYGADQGDYYPTEVHGKPKQ